MRTVSADKSPSKGLDKDRATAQREESQGGWEITFDSPDMCRVERLNPDDASINQSVVVRDRFGEVSTLVYFEPERDAVTITDAKKHVEWFVYNSEGRLYMKQNNIDVTPETYIHNASGSTTFNLQVNSVLVTLFGNSETGPFKGNFDYINVFNSETSRHVGMWVGAAS